MFCCYNSTTTDNYIGIGWSAVLDCIIGIIRALRMGSCLSADGGGGGGCGGGGSPSSSPMNSSSWRRSTSRRSRFTEEQQQLHRIPGRMFLNGASGVASIFTQQGKKGTNQDAMLVWENFGSRTDTVFCGVFDGHGPYGHMVARRVRDSLPLKLSTHWEVNTGNCDSTTESSISTRGSSNSGETASLILEEESSSIDLEDKERHPEIFTVLKESFLKAFKVMDKELKLHPHIDCFCSGTTAVTLVKQGQDLVIGNIGDSRAVLCTRDQNDCLVAVQLTVDLKPNLPSEEERIKRFKGRVFALQDEPDVARVWLPNNDSPGLAMARAFGDFCLKDYGLISTPEVSYRRLSEKDEFIVLATDGVWDVLSNKEVVNIVASAPARSSAARSLVESAVRAWKLKYPTSKIDDCAVVCLFLGNNESSVASINNASGREQQGKDTNKQEDPSNPMMASGRYGTDQSSEILVEEVKGKGKGGSILKEEDLVPDSEHEHEHSNLYTAVDGDEWSALEGVSRVNTLLTLPRFNITAEKPPRPRSKK